MLRVFLTSLVFLFGAFAVTAGADAQAPAPPDVLRLPPIEEATGPNSESPASAPPAASSEKAEDGKVSVETEEAAAVVQPPEYLPVFFFPAYREMKAWDGSFELGLDGTTGDSETFNFRFGLDLERKWDVHQIDCDIDYTRKSADGNETANRSILDWRYERLFRETPWTWFVHGSVEYNAFEEWDSRIAADTGIGYKVIATDATKLISRVGGGFSREFGLPDEYWAPELMLGIDFEHKVGKRHRLKAKAEYMPDVTKFASYRLNSQGSWEMLIDEEMNLSLKLSVISRYDSTPDDTDPSDLDYAAVVMWRF